MLNESDRWAKASAMIYSLVENAKVNNLNTYNYLEMHLTIISQHMDDKNLDFIEGTSLLRLVCIFYPPDCSNMVQHQSSTIIRKGVKDSNSPHYMVLTKLLTNSLSYKNMK